MSAALASLWAGLGKWRWPLVIGLLAALALTLAYCQGQGAGRAGEKLKRADEAAELDARADAADAAAADARVNDARTEARQRKELDDAAANASDADDARRRGCALLRQQGRDPSEIAACR